MLVDSLFRGWPFGTLLLWEVKPDCFKDTEGIPHRPFWQIVDRTDEDKGSETSPLGQPATYQMVLDGQQRVQSIILALGGDQWGFKLPDSDWARYLEDGTVKSGNHWSKATLCLDLVKFASELKAKNDTVRKIEAGKILEWVILDSDYGQSGSRPVDYESPLKSAKDKPGQFIRLSRFWDLVQKGFSESNYKNKLAPLLKEHGVSDPVCSDLLSPLAEFMKVVEDVKTNSFVNALQIESFEVTPEWSKDDYSDAIVNIFTRLNTAGRTLTREEITLAWLKVGWLREYSDKPAGECVKKVTEAINDREFNVEIDDIIRLISFVWAVEWNSGKLLAHTDLLKGDVIRPMAANVSTTWKKFEPRVVQCTEFIKNRFLVENQGSFNAIIVYLTWYRMVFDRFDTIASSLSVTERDGLEKQLNERAVRFLDRWIFGSQWAGVWSVGAVENFQKFATDLNSIFEKLKTTPSGTLIVTVDDSINVMMARVSEKAIDQIRNVLVRDRRRVSTYRSYLWVWHRLEVDRWQYSSIPMREGRKRTSKLEVDHTVANTWWERLVAQLIQAKQTTFVGTEEEKKLIAPDEFESSSQAYEFINMLGNCSLLEKSFNISKNDRSMRNFLEQVHEFKSGEKQIEIWENALSLNSTLTSPDESNLKGIKNAIETRDTLIRKDLEEFINGRRWRVDLD